MVNNKINLELKNNLLNYSNDDNNEFEGNLNKLKNLIENINSFSR